MPKPNPRAPVAREEYVIGSDEVTLETLAKKHSINVRTLEGYSGRERWVEKRAEFRQDVADRARKKLAKSEAELRARQMKVGRVLQSRGLERIKILKVSELDPDQARRYVKDGSEIERKALGLEDGTGNVLLNLNLTPEDLERMSDEELSALHAKIKTAAD